MVSIIIPVYNREKYISRAIDSVLKQTFHDWELLIVYDSGTDKTIDMVNNYCNIDTRIHCLSNEYSKCPAGARNTGIKRAQGKYIAFLDSDDEWVDIHLQECMDALNTTKYSLCSALWIENKFNQLHYINQEFPSNHVFYQICEHFNVNMQDKLWLFNRKFFEYIVYTDYFCSHIGTIVVERDLLIKLNGFNVKFYRCEDMELIYRLYQSTSLVIVNNYHLIYHYGYDNLYAFTDHMKTSIDELRQDQEELYKWITQAYYRILSIESMLKLIDSSEYIQDKKKAKRFLSDVLYNRCMSYSYINRKYSIKNRLFGFIRAIKYMPQAFKEESMIPLPGYRKNNIITY